MARASVDSTGTTEGMIYFEQNGTTMTGSDSRFHVSGAGPSSSSIQVIITLAGNTIIKLVVQKLTNAGSGNLFNYARTCGVSILRIL
jgi:hypothetical protein